MTKHSARDSFRRKVELLEKWAASGGLPEGERIPLGPTALARWTDQDRGLFPWANPNVAAPAPSGHYPELRSRFDAAITKLKASNHPPRAELQDLKRRLCSLAQQVAVLAGEHRAMSEELARERQLKDIARAELAEARAELARVVPLR